MKRARIPQLRDNLRRYLDHVRAGGTVVVLDRGKPIAEIRPIGARPAGRPITDDERLDALEREGIIRRGTGRLPNGFLEAIRRRGPIAPRARLVEAILEEREESP
ncbi:MAG: hypothetical protein L0323_05730 [Planctomycetes bacterium]|nr:hypothetical protein [Planctomycetota bacterium]